MEPSFELFDHTADIGIRVRAATLPDLIAPTTEALYAVIGDLITCDNTTPVSISSGGPDQPVMLRDYLAEVLTLFDRDRQRVTTVNVAVFDDTGLKVEVQTAPIDAERSVYHHEVKAITYHELDIRSIAGGYEATLIVDI